MKFSNDNRYTFLTDNSGFLLRIINNDIFSLKANFQVSDTIADQVDTLRFYDCSLGYPDGYLWDFGDGTTSNDKNPNHAYQDTGFFSIKLKITKNNFQDSIIKEKFIYILPNLKANFDYIIDDSYPVLVQFKNKSVGRIDSLKWNFGDTLMGFDLEPQHEYFLSGSYSVSLTIYSLTLISTITKNIQIKVKEPNLQHEYFYEHCDTSRKNFIAIKGWEDVDNYLIYHLQNDKSSCHGAYKNFKPSWEENINNKLDFLVKRKSGFYTYILENSIFNLDRFNNKFDSSNYINSNNLKSVRCYFDNLVCTSENNQNRYLFDVLDSRNKVSQSQIFKYNYANGMYTDTYKLYSLIVIYDSLRYDFDWNYYFYGGMPGQPKTGGTILEVNESTLPFTIILDMIRLNDSTLLLNSDNSIINLNNKGYLKPKNYSIPTSKISFNKVYTGFHFKNLLKLNDSTFVICGNYNSHPMYAIINQYGEIMDTSYIDSRFGSYEFASITPDNNLLFSGYRYLEYDKKYPYFVKTNDPLIRSLISGNSDSELRDDIITNLISIPNPTHEITDIKFDLKIDADLQLKIFNTLGTQIYVSEKEHFKSGSNIIPVNFRPYSIGYYYYVIEANSIPFAGKIVYLK